MDLDESFHSKDDCGAPTRAYYMVDLLIIIVNNIAMRWMTIIVTII
jgi:hypothetical protein